MPEAEQQKDLNNPRRKTRIHYTQAHEFSHKRKQYKTTDNLYFQMDKNTVSAINQSEENEYVRFINLGGKGKGVHGCPLWFADN